MPSLNDKVALVTGASRGVGKGIALALGEAGAIVYITGRTLKRGQATVPLSGTLTATAREITRLGGKGIACQCDHKKDGQVRAVFKRIKKEQSGLDVLVNNVWAGYENLHQDDYYTGPFWERPAKEWDAMHNVGLRSHYIASQLAAPLMVKQGSGLIVNISFYSASDNEGRVCYGTAKLAADKMAVDMARDLRPHGVACVSLWPGYVRTEGVMRGIDKAKLPYTESPMYTGRAVASLATDPHVIKKTGQIFMVAELAKQYGFTDTDDTQPKRLHLTKLGRNIDKKWCLDVRKAMSQNVQK